MAQRVNVTGVGAIDFPDGMSREAIAHAIETELAPTLASKSMPDASLGANPPPVSPSAPVQQEMPTNGGGATDAKAGFNQGVHDVGHGLAHLAMMPFDAARALVVNPIAYGVNKVAGSNVLPMQQSPGEALAHGIDTGLNAAGVQQAAPEQMGVPNKLASNVIDFGTQAIASAPALIKAATARGAQLVAGTAPKMFDSMLKPYAEAPAQSVLAGDVPAAAGAATGLTTTEQAIPDKFRQEHPIAAGIADFLGMTMGATGGHVTGTALTQGPQGVKNMIRGGLTDKTIPYDPETGAPIQNASADRAAKFLQGQAEDPRTASNQIASEAAFFRDNQLPVPTTGQLSGDRGLQGVENAQRARQGTASLVANPEADPTVKQKFSFGARDAAQKQAAIDEISGIGPEGANPQAFPQRVADVAGARVEQATRGADKAAGEARAVEIARSQEAQPVAMMAGEKPNASAALHDQMVEGSLKPMAETNSKNYDAARAAASGETRPLAPILDQIDKLTARLKELPGVQSNVYPTQEIEALRAAAGKDGTGSISADALGELRSILASKEETASRAGDSTLAKNTRAVKKIIDGEFDAMAAEGGPAGEKFQAAKQNYAENMGPTWNAAPNDPAAKLRSDVNAGMARPSQTANQFLQPGQVEKAASLERVIGTIPDPTAATKAARDYLISDMASKGVIQDGKIHPEALKAWSNSWGPVLDRVPGVRDEVNSLVDRASRGSALAKQYEGELKAAESNLKATNTGINRGALGLVLGGNGVKDAEHAVASVFGSGNPVENMRQIVAVTKGNKAASEGLKKAVSDYFEKKVTDVATAGLDGGTQSVNFSRLTKQWDANREVLAQVFTPAEMNAVQRAQRLLEPLVQKSYQATVGSPTAERNAAMERTIEVGLKLYYGMLKGGGLFRTFKLARDAAFGKGETDSARLVSRAMFDPELAQALLTRDVKEAGTPGWNKNLMRVMKLNAAARGSDQPQ